MLELLIIGSLIFGFLLMGKRNTLNQYVLVQPQPQPVSDDIVEEDYRILLQESIQPLKELGFEDPLFFKQSRYIDETEFGLILTHAQSHTAAIVLRTNTFEFPHGYEVRFFSQNPNRVRLTCNYSASLVIDPPARIEVQNACQESVAEQFFFHQSGARDERPFQNSQAALDLWYSLEFEIWQNAFYGGYYKAALGEHARLTPKGVAWIQRAFSTFEKPFGTIHDPQKVQPSRVIALALDYERQHAKRKDSFAKILVLITSLILFMLAFGFHFDLMTVVALTIVVGIHEFGHWFTMRCFGYRDTQIFFVPLLGAATLGKPPENITSWKQILVFLMGPLPGIALGFTCLALHQTYGDPFFIFGVWFLILNYLNLIPLVPFDGGHIANLAFFNRLPVLRLLFGLFCALVLLVCAWKFKSVFLALLGLLNFLLVKPQKSLKEIVGTLKEQYAGKGLRERELLKRIYAYLDHRFPEVPTLLRYRAAPQILSELKQVPVTLSGFALAFSCYVSALCLPIVLSLIFPELITMPKIF